MAQATNSTEGTIVLGGDLLGNDAYNPTLRPSGVTPGSYPILAKTYIDSKGRITSSSSLSGDDLDGVVSDATYTTNGIFKTSAGLATSGESITLDASGFPATGSSLGFAKAGMNVSVTGGVWSIPDATTSVKGVASFATPDFSVTGGAVSIGNYTTFSGNLSAATGSTFGLIQPGSGFSVTSDVLTASIATTGAGNGLFQGGTGLTLTAGVCTITNASHTDSQTTFTKAQNGTVSPLTGINTYTPNFQTGTVCDEITLTSNLSIQFPTTLAPVGSVVRRVICLKYDPGTAYTVSISGTYLTNQTLTFTNTATSATDILTLICTDSVCFAMLNTNFM